MLSLRTSFETILSELQKRHRAYGELLEKGDPLRSCLALKFPAFTCEVKLDGERLLAHMQKGIVKVQVRFEFNSGPVMPSVCSLTFIFPIRHLTHRQGEGIGIVSSILQ